MAFSLFLQDVISLWALWENNTLELVNQIVCYIGYKHNNVKYYQ